MLAGTERLEPRLVVAAGNMGTGKSTVLRELVRMIPNSLLLIRGSVTQGILQIPTAPKERLPELREYVGRDGVLYDDAHLVATPYGEMLRVTPTNDFFGRHGLFQGHFVLAELARDNLELGKVPIIDSMSIPDYLRGTLRLFMNMEAFYGFPKYLLHFVASEKDCYSRVLARLQRGEADVIARDMKHLSSQEAFHQFVNEVQPLLPSQLTDYRHLVVNTSEASPQECAIKCFEYILRE